MLRIFSALMGPIFAKEMVEMARRKRYYFNRVLYGGVLLFTLFTIWDSYRWRIATGSQSIQMMARMAEDLFHAVSSVQFGAVFLFVPIFLCGVIASEREEQTLDLLFTTQVSDREIVLGKLFSRIIALIILIGCALPVLSLIMLFGGVDPEALARILAATLMATLYAGAHAIYFSAVTKSPMGALVRTYWWMALWLLGLPLVVMLLVSALYQGRMPGQFGWFCMGSLVFLNPIGPFVLAMEGNSYNSFAAYLGAWFYPFTLVLPGVWSLFLIWRAIRRLRLPPSPVASLLKKFLLSRNRQQSKERPAVVKKARFWRAERTWLGQRVRNPLWLRARLARVYDREGYIGRIQWAGWLVALFFIGLLAFTESRALTQRGAATAFLIPSWIGVVVLLAILAGTSLVGDRRRGLLELILTTPMTGREIVDGTLLAVWQHVRRIFWLPFVLGLFFCLTGSATPEWVVLSLATATLFGALLLVHGVACALAARTVSVALVATFLFPLMMFFGIFIPAAFLREMSGPGLLILGVVLLVVTWFLNRRGAHPISVSCHLLAFHLVLVTLATCLSWRFHRDAEDLAKIHPGFWVITLLEGHPDRVFRNNWNWLPIFLAYLTALGINLVFARYWLIYHFDRLAGRTDSRGARRSTTHVSPSRHLTEGDGTPAALDPTPEQAGARGAE